MMVPYHLIGSPETIAKQFVLYCTDRFSRDDFEDEVNDWQHVWTPNCLYRALLYGNGGILQSRLGPWREVGIPEYSARDGEDDIKTRCDSSRLAQGVGEMHRKRCGSQMFEAVALFFGAHAVLER